MCIKLILRNTCFIILGLNKRLLGFLGGCCYVIFRLHEILTFKNFKTILYLDKLMDIFENCGNDPSLVLQSCNGICFAKRV